MLSFHQQWEKQTLTNAGNGLPYRFWLSRERHSDWYDDARYILTVKYE